MTKTLSQTKIDTSRSAALLGNRNSLRPEATFFYRTPYELKQPNFNTSDELIVRQRRELSTLYNKHSQTQDKVARKTINERLIQLEELLNL